MDQSHDRAWILFRVAERMYALPLALVAEVTTVRRPRLIPFVARENAGVVVSKGEPLPVVNGGLVLQDVHSGPHRRAVVLEQDDLRVGLLVDEVARVENALQDRLAQLPAGDDDIPSGPDYIHWCTVDGERVGLIDADALLGRVGELCAGTVPPVQQMGEQTWPNAF